MSKKEKRAAKAACAGKFPTIRLNHDTDLSSSEIEILSRVHKAEGRPKLSYLVAETDIPPRVFADAVLHLVHKEFIDLSAVACQRLPPLAEEARREAAQVTGQTPLAAWKQAIAVADKRETKERKKDPTHIRVATAHVRIKKDGLVWIEKRKRQARQERAPA